ncbi:MAG: hypothetical protein RL685_6639 [Pseudomonadota bacterium]|jgi:hypothetical protein
MRKALCNTVACQACRRCGALVCRQGRAPLAREEGRSGGPARCRASVAQPVSAALPRAVRVPVLLRSVVLCSVGLFAVGLSSVACSTGTDVVSVVGESSPSATPPAATPASPEPVPSPVSAPVPLPNSAAEPDVDEPEPSATETNFRNRRCTRDADCGDVARCQLEGGDPGATADGAAATIDAGGAVTADAGALGSSDAGPATPVDAAADPAEAGGRCVPLT